MTAAVIATIPVGTTPQGLAENPVISRTYVANFESGTVSVIDDATNTVLTTINLGAGSRPSTVGVDTSTNRVFVVRDNTAAADDSVAVIDGTPGSPTENTVVATIPVPGRYLAVANTMAVNPTTHRVYIPSFDPGGQIVVVDGSSNTLLEPISVAANPLSAAYDSVHNQIYIGHGSFFMRSELTIIDAATHAVSDGPDVGVGQYGLGVNPDTQTLYAHKGDPGRGSPYGVAVVDTVTNTVTTTIPGGASAFGGVGVDAAAGRIYVADSTLDAVRIIDGAPGSPTINTVIGTIDVGDQPAGVGVNAALGRVYVANSGGNSVSVLADVHSETYRFRPAAMMLVDHGYSFTLTKLADGRLLAVGGNPASGGITTAAEIYDSQTGTWSLTGSLNTPRDGHSATLLPDGRVLIAGGANATGTLASVEVFDPQTGTFSLVGSMAQARSGHTAVLLDNGQVLVAAGGVGGAGDTFGLASAELFDPGTGTWTPTGSLNVARMNHAGARLLDGRVLVAGGTDRGVTFQNFNSAEVYDPATGTWTLTAPMITARRGGFSLTTLPSGKVLVAGGWTDWTSITTANAEWFDPVTDTWAATTPLPAALNTYSATRLADGKVLVAGGNDHPSAFGNGTYVTTGYLFDPTTELWLPTANQLSEVRASHRAAPLPDGSALIAGGWNGSTTVPSAEIFGAPNSVPVAHAGGLYSVPEGGSVQLDASGTTDADLPRDVLTYAWDFDADGQYDDAVGLAPWFSAAELDGPTTVSVGLRVTDAARTSNIDTVAITVTNVAPRVTIGGALANSPEGAAIALTSTVADPGVADRAAGFSYAWSVTKDGAAYAAGNQASLTFTPNDNATYVVSLVATDQDGASSTEAVCVFEDGAEAGRFRLGTPPLVDHGYQFSLTELSDGRLLVVGGNPQGTVSPVAEFYDPRTGTWSLTGSLSVGRVGHSATLLHDGRVLIAGGSGAGQTLASAELFDPQTGTFSSVESMWQAREGHSAFLLDNGLVLVVAGGMNVGYDTLGLASAELFDPASGTWTPTGSLSIARMGQAGTLLVDGRPLVAGGMDRGVTFQNFDSAEVYDPASGSWSLTANPMLTARRGAFSLTTLPSGLVLAAGGAIDWIGPPTANAELFDPATGVWTSASPLPAAVSDYTATLLEDGQVLIAGGFRSGTYLDTGYLFDPATELWTATPNPLIHARGNHAAARLPGGPVLLVGGWNGTTTVPSAEIYGASRGIYNVSPTVNAGADATVRPGVTFTQTGSFTDPGADTWSATVDYGDGSGVQPLTLGADKTFTLNHVFPAGNYTAAVTVTVTDDDGDSGVDTFVVLVDSLPPTVIGITPSLAATGTLAGNATSLAITFSESMTGGATAVNFQLRSLGPDALLGTPDDAVVALTASYAGTATTLSFSPLSAGVYRLTVRDAITDVAGNPLDGDGNGAAGGDWVCEFVVLPAGGPLLGPSTTYGTGGTNPYSVTHADFNGDGKLDLAIGNTGSSDVGVLWGDGAGGFSEAAIFPSGGAGANAVATADFNGDGKPDLATTRSGGDNRVAVLLNDGAGGFLPAVAYLAGGTGTWAIAVADLNRDGKKDLVVANGGSDTVGILLGNGAGGFADAVTYASGGYDATDLAVGDFNGDGNTDVAITNHASRNVGVLLGNGTGVFLPVTTYPTVDVTHTVTAGDFNADGKDDLAVTNWFSNQVRVLLASGTGFVTAGTCPIGGTGPSVVRTGDFNGDGNADLVVAIENNKVSVLLGDGAGAFAAAELYDSQGAGFRMTVADFNADGRADLAVANAANDTVGVLLNVSGPVVLKSPHGFPLDVQFGGFMAGQLVQGPNNAFDGLNRLQVDGQDYAPALTGPVLVNAGRTVVTGTQTLSGLQVHREITVPGAGSEDFARTIDSFLNTSDGPITTTVRIVGNLGSDAATTVFGTSDGDSDIEPTDQWIGTDDADGNGAPAIIHYIHGPEGLVPSAVRISGDQGDNLEWTYEITVPAGQTVRLAHFTILADTRAAAAAAAAALITPFWFGAESDAFLSLEELESLANFQFPKDSTVLLRTTGSSNEVIVRLNGSDLEVLDNLGQVTAFSQPLRHAHSLSVIGVDDVNDRITVDYEFGGFFELFGGLQIDGARGGEDTLVVRGDWRTLGRYLSAGGWGAATLETQGSAGRTQIAFSGIEPLTIEQFRALEFAVDGVLDLGASTLTIHTSMLTGLDWLTSLDDGVIVASQGLALDTGEGLEGRGVVSARIAAGVGSTIRASGDLQLGDASSLAGFFSDGELYTGANRVTILDANKGVLGSLTVLGDETGPGTLTAPNGLILEETKALSGQGEINTPGGQFKNNGYVHSEAGGLVFNHLVTGIGDFGGPAPPVFNGGYSPGLSPAQIDFLGGLVFTDTNVLVIEIGGRNPGDEFDRLDVAGTVSLDGTLAVSLIDGFIPAAGDRFEIITAAGGVDGTFDTKTLPALPAGLEWAVVYGSDGVALVVNSIVPQTLIVTNLVPTPSGFVARFSGEFQLPGLNLYDGAGGTLGAADVVLRNGAGQTVAGSIVVDSSRRAIEFVKTGGVLAADTYTVSIKSGANAFREPGGQTLDGNADGTTGDDYTRQFTVAPTADRVISLPDITRGAGQAVNVPNAASGLPIRVSDATGVTSLAVDVVYDATLLSVTGAVLAAGLAGDWSVILDTSTPGVAKITASGATALAGENVEVVRLTAAVPSTAPYGASQAIRLEHVLLNTGGIAAVGDVALHKAAYLGDADGSGIHSSADAFLTVQAALGLATGFSAHAWTDPRIVGDADGSGVLSAADAFLIVQEGLGLSEPFVPDNPHIGVAPVGGGVDPQFQIGVNLPASVGDLVSVPVNLDIEAAATNVGGIEFELFFDPSRLTIRVPDGVSAGADTTGNWAVSSTLVAAGHLRVGMVNSRGQPLVPGRREIARLLFRVEENAADGPAALDIEPVDPRAGGYAWTADDGSILIGPASPIAGWNLRDYFLRDLETEFPSPEALLTDLADEIALVWRFCRHIGRDTVGLAGKKETPSLGDGASRVME